MRRLGLLAIVVIAAVSSLQPAGAQTVDQVPVSGTAAGAATLVFYSDPGCFHGILLDMTMIADVAPFGPGSLVLHTCDLRPTGGVLESSFTITVADGTVSGTIPGYTVTNAAPPNPAPFHFDVTVVSGTGRYAGITGTMALDGAFTAGPPPVTTTVSGTVGIPRAEPPPKPPHHPDCRHDGHQHRGWHRHGHDHG
jgi:hypothetical protein